MNTDPAIVAAEILSGACPKTGQGLWEIKRDSFAQIIREAYAETLAEKDAEIDRLFNTYTAICEDNLSLSAEVERLKTTLQRIRETAMMEHVMKEIGP